MKRLVPVLFIMLLLTACAASPTVIRVREAVPDMVMGCEFISTVHASSGGCLFFGGGLESVKDKALIKAESIGATHIVWTNLESGSLGASATGRAYKCKEQARLLR
jgi:hypothetical protein